MIELICVFYYIFSVLFMIGYVNNIDESILFKIVFYVGLLIIAPIMFPINIGYYVYKNS